ncbi:hypothetical protein PsAD46_03791 [Pseudovibrio sp. Ad46]|nr:hypothetical protein PsAD46_03791 [Pseudovibrio sp. Ad46]KZK96579.1 hypothetical protein PsAD5_02779 [Pseudovibrio sp. Ad5]
MLSSSYPKKELPRLVQSVRFSDEEACLRLNVRKQTVSVARSAKSIYFGIASLKRGCKFYQMVQFIAQYRIYEGRVGCFGEGS